MIAKLALPIALVSSLMNFTATPKARIPAAAAPIPLARFSSGMKARMAIETDNARTATPRRSIDAAIAVICLPDTSDVDETNTLRVPAKAPKPPAKIPRDTPSFSAGMNANAAIDAARMPTEIAIVRSASAFTLSVKAFSVSPNCSNTSLNCSAASPIPSRSSEKPFLEKLLRMFRIAA